MAAVLQDEDGNPAILMMKQRSDEEYDPEKIALLTMDPPPQPPGRKPNEIPLFMRKELPMNFPDNRHLPQFGLGKPEVHKGTQLEVAKRFKEKGNGFFKARRWWDAREAYTDGIEVAPDDNKLMEALWLNLAAANLELKYWPGVLAGAAEAITLNLRSSKGYFRAAHGLIHYKRYDEAVDCCKRVLEYDPTNEAILALLEDPKLGGNVNSTSKIEAARKALEEAYGKHNFVILFTKPGKHHPDNFPYLVPAIPKGPSGAKLYCNVAFKYPERHAMDLFLAISPGANIGKTLLGSLPGRPGRPLAWPQDIFFDPDDKTARHVKIVKRQAERKILQENKHPLWDPGFQYTLQSISIYLETYKRKVLMVEPEATLGEIFDLAAQSTPGELDGVCLEEGTVFFNVFRTGSKPEKLWLRGKGRKGFALAYPGYKPANKKAMLASGQARTYMIYNPRDVSEEYSLVARAEMLKGSNVMYDRAMITCCSNGEFKL